MYTSNYSVLVHLSQLSTQLPSVIPLKQPQPNTRDILKARIDNGLCLIIKDDLAILPRLDEQLRRRRDMRQIVVGEEAVHAQAVLGDFLNR